MATRFMNILALNYEYPPLGGGASPVCHEINKRYVNNGHRVSVVTMHYHDLPEKESMDGIDIIRIPCGRTHLHMCGPNEQLTFLYRARKFLEKWIPTHPVDVVHAHFILPTGLLCVYLKRKFNIPYIITSHGSDIPGFNPDRFTFLHTFTPPLIRHIIRHASFITSPSSYLRELIHKTASRHEDKIIVIPNGIDSTAFSVKEKKPIILSSGRLLARKGFRDLILAMHPVDSGYSIHILGDGPIRYKLERTTFGSKTPVIFHGWIDNQSTEYKNLLSDAAIYSLVSARENASISLLEAMASGCAIVTSDQSGCPEMVGDTAMLVRHGHPDELRQVLQKLMDDPALRNELGQKAYQRAKDIFDWDKIVEQYVQLLCRSASGDQI